MSSKKVVKEVIQTFLEADVEKALSYMAEDVNMGWPGLFDLKTGKDAIGAFLINVIEMISFDLGEFSEDGNRVVGIGRVTSRFENGEIQNSYFCDIYESEGGQRNKEL